MPVGTGKLASGTTKTKGYILITYQGISLWDAGCIAGRILLEENSNSRSQQTELPRFDSETAAFLYAKEEVSRHLETLYQQTLHLVGSENSAIFRSQQMILEDPLFCDEILRLIEQEKLTAVEAIRRVTENWEKVIRENGDGSLFSDRAYDVTGVGAELEDVLVNNKCENRERFPEMPEESYILVASMLSPGALMAMPREQIKGLVLQSGAIHAHVAILAKAMKIPTLMGCNMDLSQIENGQKAIVDLSEAKLILQPDEKRYLKVLRKGNEQSKKSTGIAEERFLQSGMKICANLTTPEELTEEVEQTFHGIGLFRTEFLYMNRETYPTEEEQYQCYRSIMQKMGSKPVVFRTIDLGDDKSAAYLDLPKETNPSLGYRGIRLCLDRPDVFRVQLRALLRAAVYGDLRVLYPMITSEEEVDRIQELVTEIAADLEQENLPYRIPKQGIMIETPAAVLLSDRLAAKTDFFSIGTNDLAQYTLAVDRQSTLEYMNRVYNPHHPAILEFIRMTVENAHRHQKQVCICGEMGSDLSLLDWFVEIGVDSLSVAPVVVH